MSQATKQKSVLENKFINIDETDIREVLAALQAGQLAGTADIVSVYEEHLAAYFDVNHALAVSSGTAALHLLLYMLDIGPGDEVIVPPTAPIMSALPILAVGATPVFADVKRDSFAYDIVDLEHKLTSSTRAVITVPMWGYPAEITDLQTLTRRYNVTLIEDASHCHGSRSDEGLVGTIGDLGFFSTQERKLVATGEGGFILTNNDDYADRIREIRDFGKPVRITTELLAHKGQYGYLFGLNFRLAAMSAALGISQLQKLPKKIALRTANAAFLRKELSGLPWLKEFEVSNATPNYYSMLFHADHPMLSARKIAQHMYEQGVVSDTFRFDIRPLYDLPLFSAYQSDCLNADRLLRHIITLPTHEGLSIDDLRRIVTTLKNITD